MPIRLHFRIQLLYRYFRFILFRFLPYKFSPAFTKNPVNLPVIQEYNPQWTRFHFKWVVKFRQTGHIFQLQFYERNDSSIYNSLSLITSHAHSPLP